MVGVGAEDVLGGAGARLAFVWCSVDSRDGHKNAGGAGLPSATEAPATVARNDKRVLDGARGRDRWCRRRRGGLVAAAVDVEGPGQSARPTCLVLAIMLKDSRCPPSNSCTYKSDNRALFVPRRPRR